MVEVALSVNYGPKMYNCFQLRRQVGHTSRHNEENPVPNFIPIITSEARVTWEGRLETEQLEVNYHTCYEIDLKHIPDIMSGGHY